MKDFQFDFEKLKVYEKSLEFIDKIFKIYKILSQDYKISIGSNLVRAALSIANSIAEGNDKLSSKEHRRVRAQSTVIGAFLS
ncbi:four helix bundle protein, partial [Candidatus Omnitrophota bacterium]